MALTAHQVFQTDFDKKRPGPIFIKSLLAVVLGQHSDSNQF